MVPEFTVQYVLRDHTLAPFNNVTHIGGRFTTGDPWQISIDQAISGIQSGKFTFQINRDPGIPEPLIVEDHPQYGLLLRSVLDGKQVSALASLPSELPPAY